MGALEALLIFIGAFLPWATVDTALGSLSVSGTDADGIITLVIALAVGGALAGASLADNRALLYGGACLGALAAVIVGIINMVDVADIIELNRPGLFEASIGSGLWLTVLGWLVSVGAAGVALLRSFDEDHSGTRIPPPSQTPTYRPSQTRTRDASTPQARGDATSQARDASTSRVSGGLTPVEYRRWYRRQPRSSRSTRREVVLTPEEFKRVREASSEAERRTVREEAEGRLRGESKPIAPAPGSERRRSEKISRLMREAQQEQRNQG